MHLLAMDCNLISHMVMRLLKIVHIMATGNRVTLAIKDIIPLTTILGAYPAPLGSYAYAINP